MQAGNPSGIDASAESLPARVDCAGSGISPNSSAAYVQSLVAERCLIVRQELETKYATIAADSKLLQRKLENAVTKLSHELESNKKTWKEEAVRIWEVVDTHTHEVNKGPEDGLKKTLSSLTARMDAIESRFTDGSVLGGGARTNTSLVQELVSEKCLSVRQELETKYASVVADTRLLQRKLDNAAAKLNHELETNKKTWKEEAVRLWEAVDGHTHSLNIGGSEMTGTTLNPQGLQPRDGTEGPEQLNDGTPNLTRLTFGSAAALPGRIQSNTPGAVALDEIGASLASLARQFPAGTRIPRENAAAQANPSASPTRGTPAQQFRSIPQPQQRAGSPSRQSSPPAAFRFTQHQSVVGSPMTPGQHFRGTQPQPQAAASNVRTRSMTPSRQPLSTASVATWSTTAGSPQRPVGPVPPGTPGSPQHPVPGTPIRMTPPEVTLGPPVDESGMPVFSRRFSGQHMKGDGSPSPNA